MKEKKLYAENLFFHPEATAANLWWFFVLFFVLVFTSLTLICLFVTAHSRHSVRFLTVKRFDFFAASIFYSIWRCNACTYKVQLYVFIDTFLLLHHKLLVIDFSFHFFLYCYLILFRFTCKQLAATLFKLLPFFATLKIT